MNGKTWVLIFLGPWSNGCCVPISIVTIYFEAPGRQAHSLSDSLFSVTGNRWPADQQNELNFNRQRAENEQRLNGQGVLPAVGWAGLGSRHVLA